jgi:hypothetical protein
MVARGAGRVLATALVGLLLAGCAHTVAGEASPAATSDATPTETPEAGPTEEPIDVIPAPDSESGRILEAHRIASVTSLVPITFPDRTEGCVPAGPFPQAADLEPDLFPAGTAAAVLDRWGFVAAWAQCNAVPGGGPGTVTMVAELSDPESARRAAEELAAAQAINGFGPATVPGLEEDPALLLTDAGDDLAQVFVPVGRMLAYAYHVAPAGQGLDDLTLLMTDQLTLLGAFEPTPQDDVAALPADPQGLAGLALDLPGQPTAGTGPYDFEGYLRLAIDPIRERELLSANGFAGFYSTQTEDGDRSYAVALYAFPDSARTNAVYTAFAELETAAYGGTRFTLPAVPAAPCFWSGADGFFYQRCYVGYGSYLASVDVVGLTAPDDVAVMNELLPAQQQLIGG